MHRPVSSRALEHIVRVIAYLLFVALFSACSGKETPPEATGPAPQVVTGSVTYRERVALTDAAIVEVQLLDVSVADAPAAVISLQRIRNPGQVPVHFRLEYAAASIDDTHRYTVQARIFEGDQLRFATDTAYPVITEGNPRVVEIVVIPTGEAAADSGEQAPQREAEPALEATLTTGDTTANYTAHFEGGALVSIQEDRDQGVSGKAAAEYQFKDGRLLRYIERSRRTEGGGAATPAEVELNFAFDDTGELLAATKTINDSGAKPEMTEIDGARNRASLLRNHALALRASREHLR